MSQLLCLVLVGVLLKIVPGYIFFLLHRRNGEEKNDKHINRLESLVYFKKNRTVHISTVGDFWGFLCITVGPFPHNMKRLEATFVVLLLYK